RIRSTWPPASSRARISRSSPMGPAGIRPPAAHRDPILTVPSESVQVPAHARSDTMPCVLDVRILVVEDEPKVAQALDEGLEGEGYDVAVELTGEGAFYRAATETFDAIVLDVMLPGRDGLTILQTLRARGVRTPVLVLTARDTLDDRVRGLDSGADDYLVKPFAFAELLARIRALLRRGRASDQL